MCHINDLDLDTILNMAVIAIDKLLIKNGWEFGDMFSSLQALVNGSKSK